MSHTQLTLSVPFGSKMDGQKLEYKGEEALGGFESLTLNTDKVQENLLEDILSKNGGTEYLKKYMKGSKEVSAFKRNVPIISYDAVRPYIQRIANGEGSSLITSHPVTEMLISSGTSLGEPKLMPTIAEDLDRRTFMYNLITPIVNRDIPGLDEGKAMYLYFVKAEKSTPSGLPARSVLTSYYKSKHFRGRARDPFNDFTSPDQAIICNDSHQSMYCQLLAGLVFRNQVIRLGAVFASAFLRAMSFLEKHWSMFCTDIRIGKLDPSITDPECQTAMSSILLSADKDSADEIERICSCESWEGIICQIWPKAKYIEAVVTGSMAQYVPSLESYSGGKLPLVCPMYASSESYFGVNLNPLAKPSDVVFTLLPNMCYFEFIPLGENDTWSSDEDEDEEAVLKKVIDLAHVRVGCYYEIVVTTYAGLYRYRIGDVLKATGFHNKAPQFRFICRKNVVLSIDSDKTNEEDLHKSVTEASKLLEPHGLMLVEYTSCADTSTMPGHYVLFWEIKKQHKHKETNGTRALSMDLADVLRECCFVMEEQLDYIYRRCRSHDKSVGPLEIRVVKTGTFESLMDFYIKQGGSINQYKTPRCITSGDVLKLLDGSVEESCFSPRDPTWVP